MAETGRLGRLPVVNFAAGGMATPADAALMMTLEWSICWFRKSPRIRLRARAIVLATTFYDDSSIVTEAQKMIEEKKSMLGLNVKTLELRMQDRDTD